MKTTRRLATAAALFALSGAVAAQTGASPGINDSSRGTASPAVTSPAGGAAAATGPAAAASHELKAARLSKLDGVNIYSSDGKKIGEVEDLVVDPASGRVLHASVAMGGVLGVGDKKFAVPIKQLRVFSRSAEDTVPVKVELATAAESLSPLKALDKDSPYVMGTRLIGTDVQDSSGNEVGEIEDLVVDLQAGEAKFALVEFDDSWSVKDKLFAFPMTEIKRDPDKKQVTLAVTKESLSQRPSIEKSRLDKMDLSDSSWMPAAGSSSAASTPAGSSSGAAAPKN